MRIAQLSQLNGSEYGATALARLLEDSPLVQFLELNSAFQEEATESKYRPVNATGSLQTRNEGGGYTPGAITLEAQQESVLRFHGGAVKVDETRLADAERGLLDIRQYLDARIPEEFQTFLEEYETELMKGTGTGVPCHLKGLKTILNGTDDIPGYTGVKCVINANDYTNDPETKSFDLTDSAMWKLFVQQMRLWLRSVPNCNGIWMSPLLWSIIAGIADEMHALTTSMNQFGVPVKAFDNITLIPLLDDTITNDEPDDDNVEETTSLYIVRAQENFLSLLTNSGLTWKDFDLEPTNVKSGATSWEIRSAWRIKTKKSIYRVRNIKVTTV